MLRVRRKAFSVAGAFGRAEPGGQNSAGSVVVTIPRQWPTPRDYSGWGAMERLAAEKSGWRDFRWYIGS